MKRFLITITLLTLCTIARAQMPSFSLAGEKFVQAGWTQAEKGFKIFHSENTDIIFNTTLPVAVYGKPSGISNIGHGFLWQGMYVWVCSSVPLAELYTKNRVPEYVKIQRLLTTHKAAVLQALKTKQPATY